MKKVTLLLILCINYFLLFAQAPSSIGYQAVVRDASNLILSNTAVGVRISIIQGSISGNTVYAETQNNSTNENGLLTLQIGNGTAVVGDMSLIDWGNGPYFIKTETDPEGGSNYTITGTTQIISVPYAFHAQTADSLTRELSITLPFEDSLSYNGELFKVTNTNSMLGGAAILGITNAPGNDDAGIIGISKGSYSWGSGVRGESYSYDGFGVFGKNTIGTGVFGSSDDQFGIKGNSINGVGGYFYSMFGTSLVADNTAIGTSLANPNAKLTVWSDKPHAAYFTSGNTTATTSVLHAEYTGSDTVTAVAIYGKSIANGSGSGGFFSGGYTGVGGEVTGSGTSGYGVYGYTTRSGGAAIYASTNGDGAAAIELNNGSIKVSGSNPTAFIFEVTTESCYGISPCYMSHISNPLTDWDPDAMIFLTPINHHTSGGVYSWVISYNNAVDQWYIHDYDSKEVPIGQKFNVLVIKK